MNCKDCKKWHSIRYATYYRDNQCYEWTKAYENDELRETIDGEQLKVEIYDGHCDISKDYISDNWDGVTVKPDFGCKFFEQKEISNDK